MNCIPPSGDPLLTSTQIRTEFGGITLVTLWRWRTNADLGFPDPIRIRKKLYWRRSAIEAWMTNRANRIAAARQRSGMSRRKFSDEQLTELADGTRSKAEVAEELGISLRSLNLRKYKLARSGVTLNFRRHSKAKEAVWDRLRAMEGQCLTQAGVAQAVGLSAREVNQHLRAMVKAGMKPPHFKGAKALTRDRERVLAELATGKTLTEIAKLFGVDLSAVSRFAKRHGIERPKR